MSITHESAKHIESSLGLSSPTTIENSRAKAITESTGLSIIVGLGAGAVPAINEATSKGNITFVFETEPAPGGKLQNVAAEKPHRQKGTTAILQATSNPNVYTFFNAQVALNPSEPGLSLDEITKIARPSRVLFSTGTIERHATSPNGKDYEKYSNHQYAYTLTRAINDHITTGERLGTLDLDFDDNGDAVIIVGAGLVGLEDLPAGILAWQIDRILAKNGINPPPGFDYLQFAAKPRKYFKLMYEQIVSQNNEDSEKIISVFGENVHKLSDGDFANRLHEKGVKNTIVIYRGSENDILNKPGTTIKAGSLKAFPTINLFKLELETQIAALEEQDNHIESVTLRKKNGESSQHKPSLVIHSIGGVAPEIEVNGQVINPDRPIKMDGTIYSHLGNVIMQLGNMAAAIEQTEKRLLEINDLSNQVESATTVQPDEILAALAYLADQGILPANPLQTVLETYPEYLLQEWGWIIE